MGSWGFCLTDLNIFRVESHFHHKALCYRMLAVCTNFRPYSDVAPLPHRSSTRALRSVLNCVFCLSVKARTPTSSEWKDTLFPIFFCGAEAQSQVRPCCGEESGAWAWARARWIHNVWSVWMASDRRSFLLPSEAKRVHGLIPTISSWRMNS